MGIGNVLLFFALEMMIRLALVGSSGVLEHPDLPEAPDRPSIWRLCIMHWILELPGMECFSLSQGLLGAPTPKPTRLLAVNVPSLMTELRQHHVTPDLPRRAAIGTNAEGQWKTMVLKEYPPAMCRALAASMVQSLQCRIFVSDVHTDERFLLQCQKMEAHEFTTTIGQDFAGH